MNVRRMNSTHSSDKARAGSKTHNLDDVQSFFSTGDEDADDDVADADKSGNSGGTAAQ